MAPVSQGEVWSVELDPVRGQEQAGTRPALVVSVDGLNQGPAGLAIVLPITKVERARIPTRVRIDPPEGGVKVVSYAICEQVRTVSTERLRKRWGRVSRPTLERAVRFVWLLTRVPG